jgi:hypothetical protein
MNSTRPRGVIILIIINSKRYVIEPKGLWDTQRGVMHVNCVLMGMNNTPLTTRTKIIEPMLFADYPKQGIAFLVSLGNTFSNYNRHVMEPKRFFIYPKRGIAHPLSNFG